MAAPLTIGQFASITHLTVKTLRHYQEVGLLAPDHVDPHSGYRYYSTAQVATAQVIRRFRDLDMPLPQLRRLVSSPDLAERNAVVAGHLERLEAQLASTREAVAALHRLLDPLPAPVEVTYRPEPGRVVTAVEADVELTGVLDWYGAAMRRIDAALTDAGATRTGPPGGLYDDSLFTEGDGHAVVYVPSDGPVSAGDVQPLELPPRELAVTVHRGGHHDIDVTYAALGTVLAEHLVVVDGPVHETYLVGPSDTADPDAWRTEIGWPVFVTSGAGAG
jgi:DNA-binding transcriptional MerR regulator